GAAPSKGRRSKLPPPPVPLLPADVVWMLTLPDPPSAGGAMDGQRVYIPLSSGRIVGLDRKTGEMVWMREIESAWPPVADGDTVYVVASDALHALDAETGDTKWRSPIEHMAIAPISASGAVVVVMIV